MCRDFQCVWLMSDAFKPSLRPDKSNVLIRAGGFSERAITLQPLGNSVRDLTTEDMLKVIASCIVNEVEVNISVPTRPGYISSQMTLNTLITRNDLGSESALRQKVIDAILMASRHITNAVT